jgi:hypothetical protein
VRALLVAGLALAPVSALGQTAPPNYVELRAAHSPDVLYRYVEYLRFFPRGPVLDVVYFGVPGQNEVYAGVGYPLKATSTLTVTPLVYGVLGNENGERGVALGTVVLGTVGRWSIYTFAGYFEPLAGTAPRYVFVDSGDLSRKLGRFELGVSTGLFYAAGDWSGLLGPLLVRNDARGAWRLALRGGSAFEVRLGRTLSF